MTYKFFAENQDIPEERLVGKQIEDVFYSKDMTVLHLSENHSLFIHHDTGETNLVEIDVGK